MFTSRGGWEKNNNYVSECSKKTGWPALYYSDPAESAEELEAHIRNGGFLGVKCYLNRTPMYLPEAEIRVFDFFPKNHLEVLNRMGAIAMLHIPRHGRLKDPVNLAQILELKREFPRVRLVIAHIGRAYTAYDVGDAFDTLDQVPDLKMICAHLGGWSVWTEAWRILAGRPNVWVDSCSSLYALQPEAAADVIRHYGADRVFFGTDYPMWKPEQEVERFLNLPLTEREQEMIAHENFEKFLSELE
jgi:predicted TIM-barrel fold metal-dependent hydrolase